MTYTQGCVLRGRFSFISMAHWCSVTAAITRSNPFPGAIELLERLQRRQVPYATFPPTAPYARPRNTFFHESRHAGIQVADHLALTPQQRGC